jgi:hypothetical protein
MFFIVFLLSTALGRLMNAPLLAVLLLINGPALDQPPGSVMIGFRCPPRAHHGSADDWNVRFSVTANTIATSLRKTKYRGKTEYADG